MPSARPQYFTQQNHHNFFYNFFLCNVNRHYNFWHSRVKSNISIFIHFCSQNSCSYTAVRTLKINSQQYRKIVTTFIEFNCEGEVTGPWKKPCKCVRKIKGHPVATGQCGIATPAWWSLGEKHVRQIQEMNIEWTVSVPVCEGQSEPQL